MINLTKMTANVNNIQALSDLPNQTDGLDAQGLKERFDKAGSDIKSFINNTLIEEAEDNLNNVDTKVDTKFADAEREIGENTASINTINEKIDGKVEDSGWKDATLDSRFTQYDTNTEAGPLPAAQYRKIGKMVEIRGCLKPTSKISGGKAELTMFTIPEGYRPSMRYLTRICQGSEGAIWCMHIWADGRVTFTRYRNGGSYATCETHFWLPFHEVFYID